jgi:sulfur carrier protein ThiS
MKVRVALHGTLSKSFRDYEPAKGMEVEIPARGTVKDLLAILEIPEALRPVVVLEGRVLKEDEEIPSGSHVSLFQPIHGG